MIFQNKPELYYIPKNFKTQEFVDKATYTKYGDASIWFIDARILITMDKIRDYFGKPITVNNWASGKDREWSGLRTPKSPYYSQYSQHSFGRAVDFLVSGVSAQDVRNEIIKNPWHDAFKYITTLEDGVSWVHADMRAHDKTSKGILLVNP